MPQQMRIVFYRCKLVLTTYMKMYDSIINSCFFILMQLSNVPSLNRLNWAIEFRWMHQLQCHTIFSFMIFPCVALLFSMCVWVIALHAYLYNIHTIIKFTYHYYIGKYITWAQIQVPYKVYMHYALQSKHHFILLCFNLV